MRGFVRSALLAGGLTMAMGCSQSAAPDAASGGTPPQPAVASSEAARAFLAALADSTRTAAALDFDGAERRRMFVVPTVMVQGGRRGLTLSRMTPQQREAAWRLLGTGLSEQGLQTARAITANEALIRQIELADTIGDRYQRNPLTYYVSVFGTPGPAEPWSWRFEGHHLSVHATHTGSTGTIVAPLFMGANPHRVLTGPTAGSRMLAREEDVGRDLIRMLDETQRKRALLTAAAYRDIQRRNDPAGRPRAMEGLPAGEMTAPQKAKLRELVEVYAGRMTRSAAQEQLSRLGRAGFDRLHFIWAGAVEPGQAHYYRVHGPTLLVEYDNAQNNANHSHTVWRDLENDFGGDLLQKHYQHHPH